MKKLLLLALIAPIVVWASTAPYSTESEKRFQALENKQTQKVVWDFAQHGGTVGTIGLGKYLPAKAIITRSFIYIVTSLTPNGSTFAVQCEDANNIFTAADLSRAEQGGIRLGTAQESVATANTGSLIASGCEISAVIGTSNATAGKVDIFLEYYVAD